jgi:hypothetical protein
MARYLLQEHDQRRTLLTELKQLLDTYLLPDLESMGTISEHPGGAGYPMIQTILAAMELLGMLLSGDRNTPAFNAFWREFARDHPRYNDNAREVFRAAIRHKSAHLFLIHRGIRLTKIGRNHMTRTHDGYVNIDLLCLEEDFRGTYSRLFSEMLSGARPAAGLDRVTDELTEHDEMIQRLARSLPQAVETLTTTSAESWSATGPRVSSTGAGPTGTPAWPVDRTSAGSETHLPSSPLSGR